MHLYNFFPHDVIALTAILSNFRAGSPKTARNEHLSLCAPKVTQEVNFPKQLWGCYAPE